MLAPALAQAQPVAPVHPVLASGDLRTSLDLSGQWHYSIDPYRDGMAGFHGGDPGLGHRRYDTIDVAAAMRGDPAALYEYDMARTPTATLPSSWLTHDATMRHYRGLVWYQRSFTADPKPGERQFLRFGAVNYRARIYLNGKSVGAHEGGFTTFAFEVTGLLQSGENQITIGVDSERSDTDLPPPVTDWETYGGITRAITLVTTPATYVDDAWVRLTRDGRIAVDVAVDGKGAAGRALVLAIPALGLTLEGKADAAGHWAASVPMPSALERWSPDTPRLYDVTISAGDDVWKDRIGFRTIAVEGDRILLNGKPIYLAGIALHEEEFGANPARTITPPAARALLTEIKQGLHGNYVRLAHYPHSEVMTRMADELGLLVWSEIPIYWRVAFDNPQTLATARHMLAEEILRDRNRAAIVIWSVGNETPVSAARNAFLTTLANDAHTLDDSRLVSAALLVGRKEESGRSVFTIDDPLIPALDVMAVNAYNGWYTPDKLSDLAAFVWRSPYKKPLVLSEFGAGALAGEHDATGTHKFSEEFQADYYRATLDMASRIPFLRGMSPWIFKDFRSPRRQHPVYQQGWNRKGLVSETGVRKQAFAVLADYYAHRLAGD
ncbi:glycoside hydrolase family 2 protein [Hephaestia sp. GCM10023244]|uniref:glycoside hydrolase family 2 protein n=1 Tax=unclassified Hephaestia TaxID=2631281 RepID=UPI0020779827|nr:glycoside hydrolase family 2 TIM barrel-domain containing protein [Hephaestia sp. MAHUQ-44]MCM8730869.1 beta galactosidase jelly roll domain-containing protein [Hephaestia sp. MAHUQ-44]